jgi:hypothetical protein
LGQSGEALPGHREAPGRITLRDYGHLFDEFDPAAREPAEAVIKAARDELVPRTYLSAAAE